MAWNEAQIKYLKHGFPIMEDSKLANIIGKSPNAIRIKASRLNIRKKVTFIRNNLRLKETEKQLIISGLLGDLHCSIPKTSNYARLQGAHGKKQEEYVLWKINFMKRLLFRTRLTKINTFWYESRTFRALNEYYKMFYYKGFKSINRKILDQLNDFGLLIWYLDDGSYHKRDKVMRLFTNGFPLEEQFIICQWFKDKYNINPRINKNTDHKNYPGKIWYYLSFRGEDTKRLLFLFKRFTIPKCMEYKLGS